MMHYCNVNVLSIINLQYKYLNGTHKCRFTGKWEETVKKLPKISVFFKSDKLEAHFSRLSSYDDSVIVSDNKKLVDSSTCVSQFESDDMI